MPPFGFGMGAYGGGMGAPMAGAAAPLHLASLSLDELAMVEGTEAAHVSGCCLVWFTIQGCFNAKGDFRSRREWRFCGKCAVTLTPFWRATRNFRPLTREWGTWLSVICSFFLYCL
jgi:hypothetical protein